MNEKELILLCKMQEIETSEEIDGWRKTHLPRIKCSIRSNASTTWPTWFIASLLFKDYANMYGRPGGGEDGLNREWF